MTLELEKQLIFFFIFGVQFENLFKIWAILAHNCAQNAVPQNSVRTKQFAFRRSDVAKSPFLCWIKREKKAHLLSTYYTLSTANAKVFNVPNELKSLWA